MELLNATRHLWTVLSNITDSTGRTVREASALTEADIMALCANHTIGEIEDLAEYLVGQSGLLSRHDPKLKILFMPAKPNAIKLTGAESTSGLNRQKWAEALITKLPEKHDGRNNWLLNYGTGIEARALRAYKGVAFDETTQAAELTTAGAHQKVSK